MIIFTTTSRPWSIVHRYVQCCIETEEKLAKIENLKVKCVFSILNEILGIFKLHSFIGKSIKHNDVCDIAKYVVQDCQKRLVNLKLEI